LTKSLSKEEEQNRSPGDLQYALKFPLNLVEERQKADFSSGTKK